MDGDSSELFDLLANIAKYRKVECAANTSIAGVAITGVSAFLGGLFLGRSGALIGSTVGGVISTLVFQNSFESVVTILRKMPDEDKKRLCDKVIAACRKYGADSARALKPLLLKRMDVQDEAMRTVLSFLGTNGQTLKN